MLVLFRLSFPPAGENYATPRVTEFTERIATTRMAARFEQARSARNFRKLRKFTRQMREVFNRAAVKIEALESAFLLPISNAIEIPNKERFS